ncbi:MAG: LamG domain-containing protein [Pirellulales bacterium]
MTNHGRPLVGAVLVLAGLANSSAVAGPYSDAVLADNPIAYYRLDETVLNPGADNVGTAGAAIDGTFVNLGTGPAPPSIGQLGPRLGDNAGPYLIDGFEANNRSVQLTPTVGSTATGDTFPRVQVAVSDDSATSPLALTGAFTLEAWIRHTGDTVDTGNNEGIVGRYRQNQNGAARSYVLYYDSTAEDPNGSGVGLGMAVSSDGNFVAANSIEFKGPINTGEWAHVAAVFEPGVRMELYVNGVSIGEVSGVLSDPLYSGEGDLWIGQQFTGADEWSFQGNIDEVAVYNTALTDVQISNHFAAATGSTPIFFSWDQNSSGDWNAATNWTLDTTPNSNQHTAVFGGATTSPRVVYNNAAITVKGIRFASANQYAIAGTGTITLSAASGNATVEVVQGAHEVQAAVTLGSNTDVNASGGSVDFNNVLNIGTQTLNIQSGRANVNHSVVAGVGGAVINAGTLGTAGQTSLSGNLTSTGTLDIDLGGTGTDEFDAFVVSGTATLSGFLDAELVNGFVLGGSESFTVLTAGLLVNNGIALTGSAANMLSLIVVGNSLVLEASLGVIGDYNGDGTVNAADYTIWRDTLGSTTDLRANGNATGASATLIDQADYVTWQANFGASGAGSGTSAIPEPSTLAMLAIAVPLWIRSRRLIPVGKRALALAGLMLGWSISTVAVAGPYSDAVAGDNPLVYYRLDETSGAFIAENDGTGGFALDGFYNQFTEVSGPRSIGGAGPRPGDIAGGYLIDGFEADNRAPHWGPAPSDYTRIQVDDTDALDITTTGLTLEAWVNRDAQTDAGGNEGIITKYANFTGTLAQRSYNLYYDPTPGVIGFALSTNGANQTAFTLQTTTNIPLGEWVHVAATYVPGASLTIYFNGQEAATRTLTATESTIHVGTAPLWIGQQFNTSPAATFEGRIDEAAIYDRALDPSEILGHFQAATGAFVGTFVWNVNGSGDWNATGNWNPASVPNTNQVTVSFGSAITTPQTVFTETDVTAKNIQFNNANKYAIAGIGDVVLDADSGSASISVTQGNHEFQAPVRLAADTNVNVAAGSLSFNNVLDLDGNTLDIQSGTVNIRHSVIPGAGGMISSAGTLAGEGAMAIGGDLASTGVLEFDIAGSGAGQYDSFIVDGTATLSGSIAANFADDYRPAVGDTFTLLTAGTLIDNGVVLTGPLANFMQMSVVGDSLVMQAVAIPEPGTLALLFVAATLLITTTTRRTQRRQRSA